MARITSVLIALMAHCIGETVLVYSLVYLEFESHLCWNVFQLAYLKKQNKIFC